jgi:hypothetical protein
MRNNEEIIEILEMIPSVGDIWQNSLPEGKGKVILWFWKLLPWERSGYNSIFLKARKVHNISLSINFDLTLEDILKKYGPPQVISVAKGGLPEKNYMVVNMFYPTQGLEFNARVPSWATSFVLGPDTEIFETVYTIPSESLESWEEGLEYELDLQPWPGYGKMIEYVPNF